MKNLRYFLFFFLAAFHQLHAQKPDISAVNKITAYVGESVTISGNGFSATAANNVVYFGAARAEVVSATPSTLEVLVPPGATFEQVSVTNLDVNLTGYASEKFLLNFNGFQLMDKERLAEKIEIQEEDGLFDVCACDFNNDGLNDIVTTNNRDKNYSITAYVNTTPSTGSDIKFQRFNDPNFLIGEETRNITCGDLDGDGRNDIVVGKGGNIADRLYLFRNISSGSMVKFADDVTLNANIAATQASSRRIKIHDMDNDGKPEIIMTDQRNPYVHVFKNNSVVGELKFSRDNRVLIQGEEVTLGLDIADINRDGKPDIVFGTNLGANVFVALNRSNNGSLSFDAATKIPVAGDLMNLVTTDIDMDGDQDIIVANFVNNIFVLLNESTETSVAFSSPKIYDTGRLPYAVGVGDINGDGRPDLVVTTNEASEPLTVLENRTTNNNLSLYQHYVGVAESQRNIKIADYSGDGKPDIAYVIDGVNKIGLLRNQHCVGAAIQPDPPNKICAGKPSDLTATMALKASYVWKNITAGTSTASTENEFAAETPGQYQVTISSEVDNCESASSEVLVELGGSNLPPQPTVTAPDAVCLGSNFSLKSSLESDVTYHWTAPDGSTYTGQTLEIQNVEAFDAGKYALVLEGDGCRTDPVFKNIDISIIPELEITATQGENFCEGVPNTLKVAQLNNGVYLWYKNGQPLAGINSHELPVTEPGNYAVKFTNDYHCSAQSAAFSTTTVAAPEASFTANENACLNETVQFTNTSTIAEGITAVYSWDFGNDNIFSGKDPEFTFTSQGTYEVSLTVNYGNEYCQDVITKTINVAEVPGIDILVEGQLPQGIVELCEGDTVVLSVADSLTNIQWNTGSGDFSIKAFKEGDYSVTATLGENSCTSTARLQLSELPGVSVDILNTESRVRKGEEEQLLTEVISDEPVAYLWRPGETLSDSTAAEPFASPEETTVYTVLVKNTTNNCSDTASFRLAVEGDNNLEVKANRVFTPNNDEANQTWVIENLSDFSGCSIVIINRYGQKVYEKDSYTNDWDAKGLPEDTYYYILKCSEQEVHTGSITVLR